MENFYLVQCVAAYNDTEHGGYKCTWSGAGSRNRVWGRADGTTLVVGLLGTNLPTYTH